MDFNAPGTMRNVCLLWPYACLIVRTTFSVASKLPFTQFILRSIGVTDILCFRTNSATSSPIMDTVEPVSRMAGNFVCSISTEMYGTLFLEDFSDGEKTAKFVFLPGCSIAVEDPGCWSLKDSVTVELYLDLVKGNL